MTLTRSEVTFLPDPERRARRYTIVSVDDHLCEPPDLFEGRLPNPLLGWCCDPFVYKTQRILTILKFSPAEPP